MFSLDLGILRPGLRCFYGARRGLHPGEKNSFPEEALANIVELTFSLRLRHPDPVFRRPFPSDVCSKRPAHLLSSCGR